MRTRATDPLEPAPCRRQDLERREEQLLAAKVALSDTRCRLLLEREERATDNRLLQVRVALSDLRARTFQELERAATETLAVAQQLSATRPRSASDSLGGFLTRVRQRLGFPRMHAPRLEFCGVPTSSMQGEVIAGRRAAVVFQSELADREPPRL